MLNKVHNLKFIDVLGVSGGIPLMYLVEKPNKPIYLFRDRGFTQSEIERIKKIITQYWTEGRTRISRLVCEELNWRQGNG